MAKLVKKPNKYNIKEWSCIFPKNWDVTRIKYKYDIMTGFTPDTSNSSYFTDENGISWITIHDMDKKYVNDSKIKITDLYIKRYSPQVVKKGSLLYSFKLSVGKVAFANKDLYTNEAIAAFVDKDDICLPFLYYATLFIEYNANYNIYGAKLLNNDLIKNSITIFPPVSIQKKIAKYLDTKIEYINGLVDNYQKQIEILRLYKKSIITQMVTRGLNKKVKLKNSGLRDISKIPSEWHISKIKYVFSGNKGLSITKEDLIDDGLPVLSYGQIHSKINTGVDIKGDLIRYVDIKFEKGNFNSLVNKNDFVFADTSEDYEGCGNCCYKRDDSKLYAGYHTIVLHSKINEDNRYFAYLFKTDIWRKQIRELADGIKVYSITQKILMNANVIVPPLKEQKEIADFLDKKCPAIDKLIELKEKKIELLNKYKKSLIYECVTGKRKVNG